MSDSRHGSEPIRRPERPPQANTAEGNPQRRSRAFVVGHGTPRREPTAGAVRVLLVLAVLGMVAMPFLGAASAAPANAPSLEGAYIVGDGAALVEEGYTGWADVWTPVGDNGTQTYTQAFYFAIFDLRQTPSVVTVTVLQGDGPNRTVAVSQTLQVPAVSEVGDTITLPANPAWTTTTFVIDGEATWSGPVATPVSFLPSYIANVGGLDLMALTIVSFMAITAAGGFATARWAMRRAVWAPKFSLIIWGHVIIACIAGVVFLDFQAIDSTFAGWSPLVYPWVVFPMFFATGLSYFNRAPKVEILRGVATNTGEMGYERTVVRAGELEDGRSVFIDESWGGFWARFWGHHIVFDDAKENRAPPLLLPTLNRPSPTAAKGKRSQRNAQYAYPIGPSRLFAFRVPNPQRDDVAYIAWAKTGEPVRIVRPKLTWHRNVTQPARLREAIDAEGRPVTIVVRPERVVRRLSLPHYEEGSSATDLLEDRHYQFAAAVWANFAGVRDLGRVVSKLGSELAMLKAAFHNRVQDELYTKLRTHYALVGRATSGVSDEEASALARDFSDLTDPKGGKA